MMFIGTFEYNLDGKNRVFLPARFRKGLGDEFIYKISGSKYPSIQLYNIDEFEKSREEALMRARNKVDKRNILAEYHLGTDIATCDSQGRFILNQLVTKTAEIEKTCIFVGFGDYIEVMSPANYNKYIRSIADNNAADEQALEDEREVYRDHLRQGHFLNAGV